jgi:riboflavin synthase alpha subunit
MQAYLSDKMHTPLKKVNIKQQKQNGTCKLENNFLILTFLGGHFVTKTSFLF